MVLGAQESPRIINRKNSHYVCPWIPTSLDPRRFVEFDFRMRSGDLLVAYSDGVDECHYQSPRTSIRPHHVQDLLRRGAGNSESLARELTELALTGVDGNPGGQDNIAVVVTG